MKKQTFLQTIVSVSLLASITPVNAIEIDKNGITGSFDTTVSWGVARRIENRDPSLVARSTPPGGTGFSSNVDDGNLNYDKGLISNVLKVTHDLDLSYKDYGLFMRGSYFRDFANYDNPKLSKTVQDKVGQHAYLLDAYISGSFRPAGKALDVRVGNQVISWGESTFIQNSLNILNPINVPRFRVPGAELREALLPVPMIWASQELSENLTLEAVYLTRFKHTRIDPTGTYFSSNDFAGDGGQYVVLGFGAVPDVVCGTASPFAANCIPRANDRDAKNSGQFGLALRWYAAELNDTEFGFYAMRYHSRLPLISANGVTTASPSSASYFIEYPEDINLLGISFNTEISRFGLAVQGEYSHRSNVPLQIEDVELLLCALRNAASQIAGCATAPLGSEISGYRRSEVGQFQFTTTKVVGSGNPFNATQWVLLGEVGVTHVYDMPSKGTLRLEGPGTPRPGFAPVAAAFGVPVQTDGYADATSWGYRFVTRLDYDSVGNGVNLSPRLVFTHDVNGTSPGPGGNFVEGRKSITLGLGATYLNTWQADASYTTYFGGGAFNMIRDRDFVAINVKYSF